MRLRIRGAFPLINNRQRGRNCIALPRLTTLMHNHHFYPSLQTRSLYSHSPRIHFPTPQYTTYSCNEPCHLNTSRLHQTRKYSAQSCSPSNVESSANVTQKTLATDPHDSPPVTSPPQPKRWRLVDPPRLVDHVTLYQELSKAKLASLVVLSTMCGYAVAPGAMHLGTLLYTTVGTALCVGSANTFNQWIEVPYDRQMMRTRNRILVRNALTPLHAFTIGTLAGTAGTTMLWHFVNPLTAVLGGANIILYGLIYTVLKRRSILNTWVGSVVGAIPPMMGWAACMNSLDPGAWLLGAVLYAWQFPHFNSLAWAIRKDYARAGYHMTVNADPQLNARVSFRYSLLLAPLSLLFPYVGVTTWWFAADSMVVNLYMIYTSYRFWQHSSDKTYRPLFFSSLIHLPVYLILLLVHKKSLEEEVEEDEPVLVSSDAS